jgi:alkylation response protein AidB-like acyl-CoA dehydrogenase
VIISGATGSFSTAFEHIRNWYYANYIYGTEEQKQKMPKLAQVSGLVLIV